MTELRHDGWRYRVIAEFGDVAVRVESFRKKSEAKALRNRLRERYGDLAIFRLSYSMPRPRWRQVKAELNRLISAPTDG